MGDVIPSVGVGHEGLRSLGGPFHRPLEFPRRPGADGLLGVDEDLRAEAAADVGRHHPELVLGRELNECGNHQPGHVGILTGGVKRDLVAAGVVVADGGPRFDSVGDQPVVDQLQLGDVVCLFERRVRGRLVANLPVITKIARRVRVHLGRVLLQRRGG